ncbi:2-keto-4-pentenoate hydratase [Lampropedia puyangensis]|uniref:2-keto-4-pentenoate hydratase n=1 Tax=Lampropedia puyangensis TaxID=1330072 RepID=A0A4S8FA82_9BURK|nr:fumarylacetoacetate hydrolase family protein [Lampropedia puyangensis]THU04483.1 2-keto-4-pentenoate hydratase [Lampropedia puyangensis]
MQPADPQTVDSQEAAQTGVAQALQRARNTGQQVDAAPFESVLTSHAQAYAVQVQVAQAMKWFDGVPGYWKSGGGSREAVLTHAPLPPAGVFSSPAQLGDWPAHALGIEAEIALRLGRDVTPEQALQLDGSHALALVDAMAVSVELVDFRWKQAAEAPFLLKLADLQSHGALVLGPWQAFEARDWSAQQASVRIGARTTNVVGTHPLGDPAWLLPQWLRHVTQHYGTVAAGTVVTTGSWNGMPYAQVGDTVHVQFEGMGEVHIQL